MKGLSSQLNEIIELTAQQTGIPKYVVRAVALHYWGFIAHESKKFKALKGLSQKEMRGMTMGFRLNYIGNLYTTYSRIKYVEQARKKCSIMQEAIAAKKRDKKKDKDYGRDKSKKGKAVI